MRVLLIARVMITVLAAVRADRAHADKSTASAQAAAPAPAKITLAMPAPDPDPEPSRLSLHFDLGYQLVVGDAKHRPGGVTFGLGVDLRLTEDLDATFRGTMVGLDRFAGGGPTVERPGEYRTGLGLRWSPRPWISIAGEVGTSQLMTSPNDPAGVDPRAALSLSIPAFCAGNFCITPSVGVETVYRDGDLDTVWFIGVGLTTR